MAVIFFSGPGFTFCEQGAGEQITVSVALRPFTQTSGIWKVALRKTVHSTEVGCFKCTLTPKSWKAPLSLSPTSQR